MEEGTEAYIPVLSYHARLNRKLEMWLKDDKLTVNIDGKSAVVNLPIQYQKAGGMLLEADWRGYGYSQTNLADDVYDGVFAELKVEKLIPNQKELPVLYDVHYTGVERLKRQLNHKWEALLDWVLATI